MQHTIKSLLLLLFILLVSAQPASSSKSVRWWVSYNFVDNNLSVITGQATGIYTYAGLSVNDSGDFNCSNSDDSLTSHLKPYKDAGLTVTPALDITNSSLTSGTALANVDQVTEWAGRQKENGLIDGIMLDYEPTTSDSDWVEKYAAYIKALKTSLATVNVDLEMCTSAWGILDGHTVDSGYGIYADTGVNLMQSMSGTYFGTNITRNIENVELELKQGVSLEQLAVGIGTMIQDGCETGPGKWDYDWNEENLRAFIKEVDDLGAEKLVIWRADIDNEGDCTEEYFLDVAREWLEE
ncbi:hypothetical protein TL16_g06469 [Triparma laevis f. inornata]|uniref:Uncharacterized protein n=1 Tax=Triparma laevis f. inornata TaxID=1714386 RepID=A0A9W7EDW4_9STRA|nr:hypothetical protein TL16_g06469 [Triparma laevis f. inornata]